MERLPSYLNAGYDARPRKENIVTVGNVRVTVITPELLRIEQGTWTDEATQQIICRNLGEVAYRWSVDADVLTVDTGKLLLKLRLHCPISADTLTIRRDEKPSFFWHYGDVALQNLGGTVCTLDEVNGACPIDDGICSIDGFATIDDVGKPVFTQDGWFAPRKKTGEGDIDLYFFGYGHDYTQAVKDYYRLTGVPEMLPAYAFGNWWCRWHRYTEEEYLGVMDSLHKHDVPLSVAVVDMDWHLTTVLSDDRHDGWTGYTWNREYFPDPKGFLQKLHDRGLHTSLNLHPAQGVRSYEEQYEEMAKAMGVPADGRILYFNCLDPKFLKAYFEVLHQPHEKDGVDFWWLDWQQGNDYREMCMDTFEPTGLEDITPLWMLNHMHLLWSRRDAKRAMLFSRYAGYGSQRHGIGFSGDTVITWESLAFQPYFTVTASNIGYSRWSHDIGGHMRGVKDDELAVRWIQFGVFSPILRLHSNDSPFLGREPWSYGPYAETLISDLLRLRHRLFPYLYTMDRRNVTELLPIMRPMYHTHPEERDAYRVPNQYWFGSEMIVAPVTQKANADSCLAKTEVWLPDGIWTDWQTGYVYYGKQMISMLRPMAQLPVLLKAGAIVPMQAHKVGENKLGASDEMELVIAPGADGAFTLYEDDGISAVTEDSPRALTLYTMHWDDKQATIVIHPVEGDKNLIPENRAYTVTLCGFAKGTMFNLNGESIPAQWDAEHTRYSVCIPCVKASEGAELIAINERGLIHNDGDCRERLMAMLIRAQGTLLPKDDLLKRLDEALARIKAGHGIDRNYFSRCIQNGLPEACYELVNQLMRIPGMELREEDSAKMTIHKNG